MMRDSEKPLKVFSALVSGLLVVSALVFFIFALGKPKVAEAALEYSAAPGFNPAELTEELQRLRKDQGFLEEVSIRSNFASTSDPNLAQAAAKLGGRLSFEANWKEPTVSIRFTHPKAATSIDVANAAVAVAKERLVVEQQKLPKDIIHLNDLVEDRRKHYEQIMRLKATRAAAPQDEEDGVKADYDRALRKLEELKAKPVFSIGSIRAAKVTSD